MLKLDDVWAFDDKSLTIQTTEFSTLFITFRTSLKIQWFDRNCSDTENIINIICIIIIKIITLFPSTASRCGGLYAGLSLFYQLVLFGELGK